MLHTSNHRMPHQTFKISMQYCINYSNRYMKMTEGGDVTHTPFNGPLSGTTWVGQ